MSNNKYLTILIGCGVLLGLFAAGTTLFYPPPTASQSMSDGEVSAGQSREDTENEPVRPAVNEGEPVLSNSGGDEEKRDEDGKKVPVVASDNDGGPDLASLTEKGKNDGIDPEPKSSVEDMGRFAGRLDSENDVDPPPSIGYAVAAEEEPEASETDMPAVAPEAPEGDVSTAGPEPSAPPEVELGYIEEMVEFKQFDDLDTAQKWKNYILKKTGVSMVVRKQNFLYGLFLPYMDENEKDEKLALIREKTGILKD